MGSASSGSKVPREQRNEGLSLLDMLLPLPPSGQRQDGVVTLSSEYTRTLEAESGPRPSDYGPLVLSWKDSNGDKVTKATHEKQG